MLSSVWNKVVLPGLCRPVVALLQNKFRHRLHHFFSFVRAFAHGVMGRQIDPPSGVPIELFLIPACSP